MVRFRARVRDIQHRTALMYLSEGIYPSRVSVRVRCWVRVRVRFRGSVRVRGSVRGSVRGRARSG